MVSIRNIARNVLKTGAGGRPQYVSNVTAEGEAVILALQTARYLIKAVGEARRSPERLAGAVTCAPPASLCEPPAA
eukprot:SAG11_NODE_35546_length_266_cov_0.616766_1_plen_75_part_01